MAVNIFEEGGSPSHELLPFKLEDDLSLVVAYIFTKFVSSFGDHANSNYCKGKGRAGCDDSGG